MTSIEAQLSGGERVSYWEKVKKTKHIEGALLTAVAMIALTGCSSSSSKEYTRRCVDSKGNVLPDSQCSTGRTGGMYPYWIYTHGGTRFNGNRVVSGYERTAPTNATVKSSTGTTISTPRGGFGSSGRGFSTGA